MGIETIGFVEIDKYCQKVLRKHWPSTPLVEDIKDVTTNTFPKPIDIITGGFPCQDVSIAGPRCGLNGKRSTLWEEFARLIYEIKPRWVVAENVCGLLSSDIGRFFGNILRDLAYGGYNAQWTMLRASWFGIPQDRDRIFIVAYPSSFGKPKIFYQNAFYVEGNRSQVDGESRGSPHIDNQDNRTSSLPILGNINGAEIPYRERVGTNDGIPHRLDRHRCLGNAIVPQVAYHIIKTIAQIDSAKSLPSFSL